ncbi:MAG: hypothetical protein OEZ27_04700 [Nitrospinota bacterium]|nr:hypothetical protein [Nitrospinota bacterium]
MLKKKIDKSTETGEAKAIADDVKQNSEKILHQDKRTDALLKGMLQHSLSSRGIPQKVLAIIFQIFFTIILPKSI